MKISFKNDYSEGCHPSILEALVRFNNDQQVGYGDDNYSKEAKNYIRKKIESESSEIFLVSGGTQANLIVISSLLKPYQCAISAATGHILNNETGAIEATGHKILGVETFDGKLRPSDICPILESHTNAPHQVMPKLVYISNSTELGTIYSKKELEELYAFCQEKNLFLFMDGARLGHALTSEINDLDLATIAKNTDVFYLGGTKNGALLGEAIIINTISLQEDFAFNIKQKGGLLAKGRLIGIQFLELMKENLYFDLAKHANQQAMKIKYELELLGIPFLSDTHTNQIFPILNNKVIDGLLDHFEFYIWKKIDDNNSAIRLITSWYTPNENVDALLNKIKNLI